MHLRHDEILSLVEQHGELSVSQLSKILGVSEVTVRSDLNTLVPTGQIRRVRGGVQRPLKLNRETPLEQTSLRHTAAKRRIGQAAANLIQDGETVFLDVGSTTTEVARAIRPTLQGVTIITNGLNIAVELERLPNVQVIVTGGTLRRLQHSLVNPYGMALLGQIHADRLILGCNGVDVQHGITNSNHEEAEIKRIMAERAGEIVVVADHSKIGQVSRAHIAPLSAVSILITDAQGLLPADLSAALPDIRTV